MIQLKRTDATFEREPLGRPFGFKGGYLSEIWQSVVRLEDDQGTVGWGTGCQSVLWSEPRLFQRESEAGGNSEMFALTDQALTLARELTWESPIDLLAQLLPDMMRRAQSLTAMDDLRQTFLLNALVPIDLAAWMLYARRHGVDSFDAMVPEVYKPALSARHSKLASIPVSSWNMPVSELESMTRNEGVFMVKFKLGAPGDQKQMLERDKQRLGEVHRAVGDLPAEEATTGEFQYYLDLNGRYESKERVQRLLDHADSIGALEQILLLEEPFPESLLEDVSDLGVRVAADESAHSVRDVAERISLGYGAIALKPIAKTLSMTLEMALEAHKAGVACFCADLTVNPLLTDWNKCVAARLPAIPGLETGLIEVNGHQNYRDWARMQSYHPVPDAPWQQVREGCYHLGEAFYEKSGGVLEDSEHYLGLFPGLQEDGPE
ncbi:MAG: mandelate racemase/muconate lactonizing enzyme family protein [Balneolaceae bacterium]